MERVELTISPAKPAKPHKVLFLREDIVRCGANKKTCVIVTRDRTVFEVVETYDRVKELLND